LCVMILPSSWRSPFPFVSSGARTLSAGPRADAGRTCAQGGSPPRKGRLHSDSSKAPVTTDPNGTTTMKDPSSRRCEPGTARNPALAPLTWTRKGMTVATTGHRLASAEDNSKVGGGERTRFQLADVERRPRRRPLRHPLLRGGRAGGTTGTPSPPWGKRRLDFQDGW